MMLPSALTWTTAGVTTSRSPSMNISTPVERATAAATDVVPRSTPRLYVMSHPPGMSLSLAPEIPMAAKYEGDWAFTGPG